MADFFKSKSMLIAVLVLFCVIVSGGILLANRLTQPSSPVDSPTTIPKNIDDAVSLAIKGQSTSYYIGETPTEGHIILDFEEKNGTVKVYTIASFGSFGFENGIFTKVSGSGAIPTVITFAQNENGEYSLLEYKEPMDGAGYTDSIKKMFPSKFHSRIFLANNDYTDLAQQQEKQATEYLKSIERTAEVSAAHVEKELANIDVEASNKLFAEYTKNNSVLNNCPYWLGTREKVENGVRYIYETSQGKTDDGFDLITFKKTKEDGTVVDEYNYKIVGSEPQLIEEENTISTTAISGIWESQVLNKKDRSQIIIDNVTQDGFNFQLFIAEYKNTDEGERVSQGGFDGKAVFKNGTSARFKGLRGDAIKEATGTLTFNGEELTIEYDNLDFYQDEYHVKLVKEFNKVSDSTFDTSGLAARSIMPFNNRELILDGKDVYKIMPEDALAIYGEPSSKERGELFINEFWETWIYDGIELTFWGQNENNKYYGITKVVIKDPAIPFVRGTKVGDSLEDVISKFPNENRGIIELYGEKVRPLYGIPIHNHDSGSVKYQNGEPVSIIYVRGVEYLLYQLVDNKVVSISVYGEMV